MAAYAMAMISTAVGGWLSDDDAASDPGFWGGVVDGLAAVVSTNERLSSAVWVWPLCSAGAKPVLKSGLCFELSGSPVPVPRADQNRAAVGRRMPTRTPARSAFDFAFSTLRK